MVKRDEAEELHLMRLKEERSRVKAQPVSAVASPLHPNPRAAATSPQGPEYESTHGTDVDALAFDEIKKAIRTEELRLMHIEEERRYIVMRQQRNVMVSQIPKPAAQTPPTVAPLKPKERRTTPDQIQSRMDTLLDDRSSARVPCRARAR